MVEQVRPHLIFSEQTFQTAIRDQLSLLKAIDGRPFPWPKSRTKRLLQAPKRLLFYLFPRLAGKVFARPGWAIGNIVDSYSNGGLAMILGGWAYRTPGQCTAPADITRREDPLPLTGNDGMGYTGEMIHPCVQYRKDKGCPESKALRGWTRREKVRGSNGSDTDGGWEWRKEGTDVVIPEYQIAYEEPEVPSDDELSGRSVPRNLERLVAAKNEAQDFLKEMDFMIYGVGMSRDADMSKRPDVSVKPLMDV